MTLEGVRVLIVEDNFIVADSLKSLICSYGGTVVATVPSVDGARRVLASNPIDVAILDIHIDGGAVDPLADQLATARIPMIFTTGYSDETVLPQRLRSWPRLEKPVEPDRLLAMLSAILGRD